MIDINNSDISQIKQKLQYIHDKLKNKWEIKDSPTHKVSNANYIPILDKVNSNISQIFLDYI